MPEIQLPDFSAGIWRGRKAPAAAVYDAQNSLIDDDGNLDRRGASAYKSNANAGASLVSLADIYVAAGRRTIFTSGEGATGSWVLDADDETPLPIPFAWLRSRPAALGGLVFMPGDVASGMVVMYGGSRKAADYGAGTVGVTASSVTVAGSGTSWLANVDAGMILFAQGLTGVVQSVESDVSLTLVNPWPGTTASGESYAAVVIGGLTPAHISNYWDGTSPVFVLTAGFRLVIATRQRAFLSAPNDPFTFDPNSYLELPSGALITGGDSIEDTAALFTTSGVWDLSDLDFDAVDDAGNPQWQQHQVSKDVILWGDPGIAAWAGVLVVPAVDDVYLFSLDGSVTSISEPIRPKYREHVNAGRQPGLATVHRGHYFLPILDGSTVVDTIVCRLDRPTQTPSGRVIYPWTRWEGHASGAAYAQRVGADTREPKLLGLAGERVTDLTATIDGQGATDADGSTVGWSATLNDIPLGFGTAARLRAWYEMTLDAITISDAATPNSDTFNRANETPLGSPWLAWRASKPNLNSNAAEIDSDFGVTEASATRPETISAGCYAQITFKTAATYGGDPAMTYYVGVRLTAHASSSGGYAMLLEPGSGGWQVTIAKGSARTHIATSAIRNYSAVQAIRLVASGSYLYGLVKIGGTWAVAVSVADSDFRDDGFVGFGITKFFGTPVAVDEFDWAEIDAPSILPEYSSDQDGGLWHELTALGEQGGQSGWTVSDGSKYQWATVNKKRERIRFRLTLAGAATSFKLRAVDLLTRASGKQ